MQNEIWERWQFSKCMELLLCSQYFFSFLDNGTSQKQEYGSSVRNSADIFQSLTFVFRCTILKTSRGNSCPQITGRLALNYQTIAIWQKGGDFFTRQDTTRHFFTRQQATTTNAGLAQLCQQQITSGIISAMTERGQPFPIKS